MYYAEEMVKQYDRAITAAPVLPEHSNNPRYIGSLQWLSGPNMKPPTFQEFVAAQTVVFELSPLPVNGKKKPVYYFRAVWTGEDLDSFSEAGRKRAALKAFKTLCDNSKIQMVFDTPFAKDFASEAALRQIETKIIDAFLSIATRK
jgi:hypothetical protein